MDNYLKKLLALLLAPICAFSNTFIPECIGADQENFEPVALCSGMQSFSVTTGLIWINDRDFNLVYSGEMSDLITLDYLWRYGSHGIGAKISYWATRGNTTCTKEIANVFEIPTTIYVRTQFGNALQSYVSLGAGFIYVLEKSPKIGSAHFLVAGLDIEAGMNWFLINNLYITAALDYLWFPKRITEFDQTFQFGGLGLRGGLGLTF